MTTGSSGRVSKIAPDGTVTDLFGTSTDYYNPSGFAFDAEARLFFTIFGNGRVYRADGGTPVHIITLSQANSLAVDALGRLAVNAYYATSLPIYTLDGALVNANFATVRAGTPIARAPGGVWGTNLLVVGTSGQLLRLNADGTTVPLGSGFSSISSLRFGPDGALYASEFDTDRIYRLAQPAVPGAQTTVHARVTDPVRLSFAPDGTLFVGRDNFGSGGDYDDAVKIFRVGPGGVPAAEYGNAAISDPDGVAYDANGSASGIPGAGPGGGLTLGNNASAGGGHGGRGGRADRVRVYGPANDATNAPAFPGSGSGGGHLNGNAHGGGLVTHDESFAPRFSRWLRITDGVVAEPGAEAPKALSKHAATPVFGSGTALGAAPLCPEAPAIVLRDVSVALKLGKGEPQRVYMAPDGQALGFRVGDGYAHFTVPRVEGYAVAVVESTG